MRQFIYYSKTAPTYGNFGQDLMKAGRLDIAIHTIIASFFLSHQFREDVKLDLIFAGKPDPEKHLELKPVTQGKTGVDKIYLSKKDIAWVIKRMLYKYKKDAKNEVFPGYWIEKKTLLQLVKELHNEKRPLYILDPKGEHIRTAPLEPDPVFILGDHQGLSSKEIPKKELKIIKKLCTPISLGDKTYFASQAVTIVNHELDYREHKTRE
jgi:tRNA (pseudouridine54-N1)-methyltransferase